MSWEFNTYRTRLTPSFRGFSKTRNNDTASGNHVIHAIDIHTVLTGRFYGGLSRKFPILLHGVLIVRAEKGKGREWSDYYDGLNARRNSLAAYFEEWVEL